MGGRPCGNAPRSVQSKNLHPAPRRLRAPRNDKSAAEKVKTDGEIDVEYAVTKTDGYSGADITELIDRATDYPLKRSLGTGTVSGLTQADMESALASVKPSVDAKTLRRFAEYENE